MSDGPGPGDTKVIDLRSRRRQANAYRERAAEAAARLEEFRDALNVAAIHLACAGPWWEWDRDAPIGTVVQFTRQSLLESGDPLVSALVDLQGRVDSALSQLVDVVTTAPTPPAAQPHKPAPAEVDAPSVQLDSGRRITVDALLVRPTWPEERPGIRRSARLLDRLPAELSERLGVPTLHVIAEPATTLPRFTLAAALTSDRGARTDHPEFRSRLGLLWFAEALERPPLALIEEAARGLAWEDLATDEPVGDL